MTLDCLPCYDSLLPAYLPVPCLPGLTLYCLLPALIFCLVCDYVSDLPDTSLSLLIEPCLFVIRLSLLIKVQMDPNSADSSLQKTSPQHNPAAIHHLSAEVSAQANVLATHHQQLNRLTYLTEELVKTLQSLHIPAPEASQTPPLVTSTTNTSTVSTTSPRLAFPEKFDGAPTKCKGFLLQCSVHNTTTNLISHR